EQLTTDLRKTTKTPNYSFIAPAPCDAGFAGQCASGALEGTMAADAFLEEWVPKILVSPAYKADGVLIVAFSAIDPAPAGAHPGDERLRTGALVISPFLPAETADSTLYGPYSLLRSTEDLFALQPLALAAGAKTGSFAADLLGENGGD